MKFRSISDLDIAGKRVLIRVDINAPMANGEVTDDTRLRAVAPTIAEVLAKGGRPILLAHFARPKGAVVPDMSLAVIRGALERALGAPVDFHPETVGETAETAAAALGPGRVLLLENTRFHPGEETNDPDFADALARLGDVYVNDAFSCAHRAHASTEALARAEELVGHALGRLEALPESPSKDSLRQLGEFVLERKW